MTSVFITLRNFSSTSAFSLIFASIMYSFKYFFHRFTLKKIIFLASLYPSCKQASSYLGVDFKCNHRDQIVYAKHAYQYVYYPITKNGTVLNQYEINLTFAISNINNKYFLNTIIRQYKTQCLMNPYNLQIKLCDKTYLLDYRQLTADNIELSSSVNTIILDDQGNTSPINILNQITISFMQNESYKVVCPQTQIQQAISPTMCALVKYSDGQQSEQFVGYIIFLINSNPSEEITQFIGHIPYLQLNNEKIVSGTLNYKQVSTEDQVSYVGEIYLYLETLYRKQAPHNLNFSRIGIHTIGWQIILVGTLSGVIAIVFTIVAIIQSRNSINNILSRKNKSSK